MEKSLVNIVEDQRVEAQRSDQRVKDQRSDRAEANSAEERRIEGSNREEGNSVKSQIFKLSRIDGDEILTERLIDMGFYPGVEIEFISRMINGGPIVIRIQSSFFALRDEEAECLKVVIP